MHVVIAHILGGLSCVKVEGISLTGSNVMHACIRDLLSVSFKGEMHMFCFCYFLLNHLTV